MKINKSDTVNSVNECREKILTLKIP